MTSALRGEGGLENWLILWTNSTDRLREMRTRGGGLKSQKFCRRQKWMALKSSLQNISCGETLYLQSHHWHRAGNLPRLTA